MSGTFCINVSTPVSSYFAKRGTEGQVHQPVITVNQRAQFCYRQGWQSPPDYRQVQGGQGQVFIIQCCSVVMVIVLFPCRRDAVSSVVSGGFGGFGGFWWSPASAPVAIMAAGQCHP